MFFPHHCHVKTQDSKEIILQGFVATDSTLVFLPHMVFHPFNQLVNPVLIILISKLWYHLFSCGILSLAMALPELLILLWDCIMFHVTNMFSVICVLLLSLINYPLLLLSTLNPLNLFFLTYGNLPRLLLLMVLGLTLLFLMLSRNTL